MGNYQGKARNIAIDIGGSKLMVGIVDREGRVLYKLKELLRPDIKEDEVLSIVLKMINGLRSEHGYMDFRAAGVAIPGLADPQKGLWVYACFSGIRNYQIGKILSSKLELPVFIDNDVNVCAYGEKLYGVCKDNSDFLWVTVSNGVGGGIILNGDIYRGPFMNAGEIGHIIVEEQNPATCSCGNKGCLEAYSSGPAIVRRYLEGDFSNANVKSAKDVADQARSGDLWALKVFQRTGFYLGKAIGYAVNLLNPQKVILGGGVTLSADLFMDPLKETVGQWMYKEANPALIIEKTAFGADAALVGAAAIAEKGAKHE